MGDGSSVWMKKTIWSKYSVRRMDWSFVTPSFHSNQEMEHFRWMSSPGTISFGLRSKIRVDIMQAGLRIRSRPIWAHNHARRVTQYELQISYTRQIYLVHLLVRECQQDDDLVHITVGITRCLNPAHVGFIVRIEHVYL
ncbi:hypothetical protein OBBRIDRAFT_267111 [Obba rivulosa]|uniref:Uncharacterized protein n=1 Tax=Obba rivulosa TaxID=1052685 RepID=A0A8E2DQ74_9APHY|nr:hypothetical protein OBBRIDRAFT_267111 [Obba rivulosa]